MSTSACRTSRPLRVSGAATALALSIAALSAPTPAAASSGESGVLTVTVPMTADCSLVTAAERARMARQGVGLCGTADGDLRNQQVGNCGTASVYVDRSSKGKGRVSWGLHSTKGPMIARNLQVNWGPAGAGSFPDVSGMYSSDYSKSRTVLGSGRLQASMHGTVGILGWTVTCQVPSVYSGTVNI
jgi:hypothetical protein